MRREQCTLLIIFPNCESAVFFVVASPRDVRHDLDRGRCLVACEVCGPYYLAEDALFAFHSGELPADIKPALSSVVRRHYEFTGKPEMLTFANCKQLASSAAERNDVSSKLHYLLEFIAHKSVSPGRKIVLNPEVDYPVCFATNRDELRFYLRQAEEGKFIEADATMRDVTCQLTPEGWKAAQTHKALDEARSPTKGLALSGKAETEQPGHPVAVRQRILQAIVDAQGASGIYTDAALIAGQLGMEVEKSRGICKCCVTSRK